MREYIEERLKDVRYYLRGINYNNLDAVRIIDGLPDASDGLFNNKDSVYHITTVRFAKTVKILYESLVADDLEFASSKKEVDGAILKFETKLKELIKNFKSNVLETLKRSQVSPDFSINIIDGDLSEINIKIRNRKEKKTADELHELKELSRLADIVHYVYILTYIIKDKNNKLADLADSLSATYKVGSSDYQIGLSYYTKLYNIRNYDEFIEVYDYIIEKLGLDVHKPKLR